MIRNINLFKSTKNKTVSDLEPGDKVRIKIAGMFTKSSEPQFSDEVYVVENVRGRTIELTDGQVKKRRNLLKVPKDTKTKLTNVIKENNKDVKITKKLKQVGIEDENIRTSKRERKANTKYL